MSSTIRGNIQKRPNGQWRARYRNPETGKEVAKHKPTKREAQQWLNEQTTAFTTGRYVDPGAGKITFLDFYLQWAERQLWTQGTIRAVRQAVDSAPFRDQELRQVRRSHIEAWVKGMTSAGLAPSTIKSRVRNVRTIFRGAVRDKVIHSDPADGVVLPRARRTEHAMKIPTPEQVSAVYSAAPAHLRPLIALCAFAGLRLGEVVAVQLGDVDFLRRTLTVRRQAQRPANHPLEIRAPKYGSERVVSLPDDLLQILSEYIKAHGTGGEQEWLFPKPDGGPAHQNTVSAAWRAAADSQGLEKLRLHDLRHFYASGLIASGCDVVTVQRALGHAKATTTLDTYSHLWPTAEDRTRAAAQSLMASISAQDGAFADSLRTADS